MRVVYVDVLLLVNWVLDLLLLRLTDRLLDLSAPLWRQAAGAAVGAAGALAIFLPPLPLWGRLLFGIALAAAMARMSFGRVRLLCLLRAVACLFVASFLFAGCMLAWWELARPSLLTVYNGVVYFDVSPLWLLAAGAAGALGGEALTRLSRRRAGARELVMLEIYCGSRQLRLRALVDTGSELREPFSGWPVVVASAKALGSLPPEAVLACHRGEEPAARAGLRLVPYRALGGEGLLPAFRPDRLLLLGAGARRETDRVYIALAPAELGGEGFAALVPPLLLSECAEAGARTHESAE